MIWEILIGTILDTINTFCIAISIMEVEKTFSITHEKVKNDYHLETSLRITPSTTDQTSVRSHKIYSYTTPFE